MRYAVVRDGMVENVIRWDGEAEWSPPEGADLVALGEAAIGPGYTWDGAAFTAPPPVEPQPDEE